MKRSQLLLVGLWLLLTAVNLNKAFHIDDTFHLEAAQLLSENPGTPMSGYINWYNDPRPMSFYNQPPLFFYAIAGFANVFGWSEVSLHLLMSIFTFLSLFAFQRLCKLLDVTQPNLLLCLFAFCPALVINQNMMVDVPVLSAVLGTLYFVLKGIKSRKTADYAYAMLILSAGLLVKYSLLPVLPAVGIIILFQRDYHKLIVLLIPIAFLTAWSYWNVIEYGSVHLIDRRQDDFELSRVLSRLAAYMGCLASISAFGFSIIYGSLKKKWVAAFLILITVLILFLGIGTYVNLISELDSKYVLSLLFMVYGTATVSTILIYNGLKFFSQTLSYIKSDNASILIFIIAMTSFLVIFAPFMATRHLLLMVPLILLLCRKQISNAGMRMNTFVWVCSLILTALLAASDWLHADFYRDAAAEIDTKENATYWSVGHWGWQWYTQKNGMKVYSTSQSKAAIGDFIAVAKDVSKQDIADNLILKETKVIADNPSIATFVSGKDFSGLYSCTPFNPSWLFSHEPLDSIVVYQVTGFEDKE